MWTTRSLHGRAASTATRWRWTISSSAYRLCMAPAAGLQVQPRCRAFRVELQLRARGCIVKILVVDDEALARERLLRLVQKLQPGAQCLEAADGSRPWQV